MTMPAQRPYQSKQDYATPKAFLDVAKTLLNIKTFNIDFAADETNAVHTDYFDEQTDALSVSAKDWAEYCQDGFGWLNPPYENIAPWAERCRDVKGLGGNVLLLIPASVGSNWFKSYVHNQAWVLFLNGRLAFIPDHPTWLYPKDCILCVYGPDIATRYDVWNWRKGEIS